MAACTHGSLEALPTALLLASLWVSLEATPFSYQPRRETGSGLAADLKRVFLCAWSGAFLGGAVYVDPFLAVFAPAAAALPTPRTATGRQAVDKKLALVGAFFTGFAFALGGLALASCLLAASFGAEPGSCCFGSGRRRRLAWSWVGPSYERLLGASEDYRPVKAGGGSPCVRIR